MNNTLTDQAYRQILSRIVDLNYVPGQKISEKNIEEEIGIGRTPVREALLHLKQVGLINVIPQSGTYVSLINLPRVNDAIYLRHNVESSIMREACQKDFTPLDTSTLKHLIEVEKSAIQEKNVPLFFHYFDRFHAQFYKKTGHDMTWTWLQNINIYFYRVVVLILQSDQPSWENLIETDLKLMNSVLNNETDKVEKYFNYEMEISPEKEEKLVNDFGDYFEK